MTALLARVKNYFSEDSRRVRLVVNLAFLAGIVWANMMTPDSPIEVQIAVFGIGLCMLCFLFFLADRAVGKIKSKTQVRDIAIDPNSVAELEAVLTKIQAEGRYHARRPL